MEGNNHSSWYAAGVIVLLILIPATVIASLVPIGMLPAFKKEEGAGPESKATLNDTGYFGKGYLFDVEAATAENLEKKLKGTGLANLGAAFVNAAQKYHLNPVYLAAHAALESGWGNSKIARDKKNLFGYGAYDRCPYECAKTFSSYEEGIMFVMGRVKRDYLTPGGKYYKGETLEAMNTHYATDKGWAQKIKNIMVDFYQTMGKKPTF